MDIKNNKKAFTLIELIVVMAIIGILVLLATPKFLNYVKEARYTNIISDIRVLEDVLIADLAKTGELPINYYKKPVDHMKIMKEKDSYIREGKIKVGTYTDEVDLGSNYKNYQQMISKTRKERLNPPVGYEIIGTELGFGFDYYKLSSEYVKKKISTKLKGSFLLNNEALIIYVDEYIEDEYLNQKNIPGLTEENLRMKGKFRGIEGIGETYHERKVMQEFLDSNEITRDGMSLENLIVEPEGTLKIVGQLMTPECWKYLKGFWGNTEIPYRMTIGMEENGELKAVCKIAFEKDGTAKIEEIKK